MRVVHRHPRAQPGPGGGNPFLTDDNNTTDTLRNSITKYRYTFEVGGWHMHIFFKGDGTGAEEDWSFKWHAKDGKTVELTSKKFPDQKAVLTFSDDYVTYTGFHFDGTTPVAGKQVIPAK